MGFNLSTSTTLPIYYGTDGNTPPGQYDLVTLTLQSIAHGLGLESIMVVTNQGIGNGYNDAYDLFTVDKDGKHIIDYPNNSAELAQALTSGAVYFDGANANAANGGQPVKLYSPLSWEWKLSYRHIDEMYNGGANALMIKDLDPGEADHDIGPVALGMLADLGWPGVLVPAPANEIVLYPNRTPENKPVGTVVGSLNTSPSFTAGFNYALIEGQGSADNASFSIDGQTLKTATPLDFETKSQYNIRIRSTRSKDAMTIEQPLTVKVLDAWENISVYLPLIRDSAGRPDDLSAYDVQIFFSLNQV